ncbi:MAG: nitroreductase family protein [Acidimicrobiales bacterium]|nr:nitroreductase family protein [Acidimicrobiales bacterium]
MCRDFADRPVDRQVVDRLLDRARRAPSAGHTQGWSFLVLEGPAQTGRFWASNADPEWLAHPTLPGLLKAPVIVVPWCSASLYRSRYSEADKVGTDPPDSVWTIDAAFATMLLLLGVTAEGLGALFLALRPAAPEQLRAEFGVPQSWQPIGAVAVGWPAGDGGPAGSASRGRRPIGEIVHRGDW